MVVGINNGEYSMEKLSLSKYISKYLVNEKVIECYESGHTLRSVVSVGVLGTAAPEYRQ